MTMSTGDASGGGQSTPPRGPLVFFGSGAFGVPTLDRLAEAGAVALVVTQPARPAGRGRAVQPTPVALAALERSLPLLESADLGDPAERARIRAIDARAFVVIAFGQKLPPALLEDRFAVNLHGSILPRWRGAAPIQRSIMEGDSTVGVSVIALADRMDAGEIFATAETPRGETETAGELHDRLARLGPDLVERVLREHAAGTLRGRAQDEREATRARKLSRADAWVDLSLPAPLVAARINGLAPWPGCDAALDGEALRVLRARAVASGDEACTEPGAIDGRGRVRCGRGWIELLEVQSPGGRVLPFDAWRRGRSGAGAGSRLVSAPRESARDASGDPPPRTP